MIYILDKFEFECSRAKVKDTVAIFRKKNVITLTPTFMDGFSFYFTQLSIMTISWTSLSMSILGPMLRLQWLFLEKKMSLLLHPYL